MSNTKGKRMFRYRLSPETFGYSSRVCVRACVCNETHTHKTRNIYVSVQIK